MAAIGAVDHDAGRIHQTIYDGGVTVAFDWMG
jgi:hypothetical protein